MDRKEAKTTYDRICQGYYESLGHFKLRFDRALEALEQLGYAQIPIENEQVILFIRASNDTKTKMINDVAADFEIPENIVEAYGLHQLQAIVFGKYCCSQRYGIRIPWEEHQDKSSTSRARAS